MFSAIVAVIRGIFISWMVSVFTRSDVIRRKTLEWAVREIREKGIDGCVAELGVYKGDFARIINSHFPERKLYLFDTFEGFDRRDVETERAFHKNAQETDFTNRSVELVLRKMKHPAMCVVRKGWFPQSAEGVEERFAFVSIDADLFAPIYSGLVYFYERLEKGGYIFVHDYNGKVYGGAKEAVRQFCRETNAPYVPLCDLCGTVVFSK